MATASVCVVATDDRIFGLGERRLCTDRLHAEFRGKHTWVLRHGPVEILETRLGIPSLPKPALQRTAFEEALKRTVGGDARPDVLWGLVQRAMKQPHGTLIVISADAANEAERLSGQGTTVAAAPLTDALADSVTSIDGAVLLDPEGNCHAIGTILDGEADGTGTPARGARFNSALRYTRSYHDALAVVISEDGHVNLLPRLRPRIEISELARLLEEVQTAPKPLSKEMRATSLRLWRDYAEYVPDADREAVVHGAFASLAFQVLGRPEFLRSLVHGGSPGSDRHHRDDVALVDRLLRIEVRRVCRDLRRRMSATRSRIALVRDYAMRCSWYDAEAMSKLAADLEAKGTAKEDRLSDHLARFLFDAGLRPLTRAMVGRLVPDAFDPAPFDRWESAFYVEAKQYGDEDGARKAIRDGARQIWNSADRVRVRYPMREAFLVVFRRGGPHLRFATDEVRSGDLVVRPVLVDVAGGNESGSRAASVIHVTAEQLLAELRAGAQPGPPNQRASPPKKAKAGAKKRRGRF